MAFLNHDSIAISLIYCPQNKHKERKKERKTNKHHQSLADMLSLHIHELSPNTVAIYL